MKKISNIATAKSFWLLMLSLAAAMPYHVFAQDDTDAVVRSADSTKTSRVNLHAQMTYIYQYQPAFYAKYSGPNSLGPREDKENSLTSTLNLGIRLWKGAEIYINPEIAGGSGLSGAYGLAASTNGETFRVGDPAPTLYLARGLFIQTIQIGKAGNSFIPEGANEVGGSKPNNYLKLMIGKMSLADFLDNNAYANDPRAQFMNWCLMYNGAWDYAANLRGYTYVAAAVLQQGSMAYKVAVATLPVVANGETLNTNLNQEYSVNAEIDKAYKLGLFKRKGNIRLLGYFNDGDMGNYAQALAHRDTAGLPNVISTRQYGRTKIGLGLNIDQEIGDNAGIFLRAGWNDGKNETWCFTEADEIISAGLSLKGAAWNRKDDNIGAAFDINGLSSDHRNYLAAGGLGFQLGDGALSYANESVLELYYSYKPLSYGIWLTGDYQFVLNPGYNSARGPVNVFSLRVHVEL